MGWRSAGKPFFVPVSDEKSIESRGADCADSGYVVSPAMACLWCWHFGAKPTFPDMG